MALVNFTNLDFDQIRTSIKDYLRTNSNFTDYDFEGSSLSHIIDILAYNTYISSYNANMISNEVFIDSATLRENVVSLARNIGYLPRSKTASSTTINFFVDLSDVASGDNPVNTNEDPNEARTVTLKRGVVCSSSQSFGSESYIFSTLSDITVPVINNIATFNNVPIYEGNYIEQEFTINPFTPNPPQRYILDNSNIDYKTITVKVKNSVRDTFESEYKFADSLFSIDENSRVFFLQEVPDEKYELLFGDGVFGKKLETDNIIKVSYLITNGSVADRISSFTFNGILFFNSNEANVRTRGISLITANSPSSGGREIEDVNSIRSYAPQNYSAQNRAVTANDFRALVPKLYPEIETLSVYGGEDLDPPVFGKVFIALKPKNNVFLSNTAKEILKKKIKSYTVAGIRPEIIDLKYLYIEIESDVYYDTNFTSKPNDVLTKILRNIENYSKSSDLNKYGSRFRYSNITRLIDNSDRSITSNITSVRIRRDLRASLNTLAEYEICFGNSFHVRNQNGYNIRSSGFNIDGTAETVYLADAPNDDLEKGSIFVFRLESNGIPVIVKPSAGTIDYVKGEIILNPLNITGTKIFRGDNLIEISALPDSNDIIGLTDLYLQLDSSNATITMFEDRIISGSDTSGTSFIKNSSYLDEDLIRK
jgi:hypothetical protein